MLTRAMLPIGDDDNPVPVFPIVNLVIIAINVAVFLYQLVSPDFTNGYACVPVEITTGRDLVGLPERRQSGTSTTTPKLPATISQRGSR